jgi:alcohol dehydrogenase (cytochrome c)
MYVTAPNECIALDAGSGRMIWQFKRPRTAGITAGSANRGAGVAGDRVFLETDNAHTLALNRFTGDVIWETALDDWRKNYAASSAPLPAGNLIISGVTGGEHGANGFVAALDQDTGKEIWRFWTVPKPGTPGSETWQTSSTAVRLRGSPAATIPISTSSIGPRAIQARSTTAITARGTTSIPTASLRWIGGRAR